jgi:1-acyl-sn-glycerol-3-phosphate acyltransferase
MFARLRAKCPGQALTKLLLYEACSVFMRGLSSLFYRQRTYHAELVPATGACLLIANHQSYLDPPAIGSTIRQRHVDYVARLGLFDSRALRWIISALNATPIREDGGGDIAAMKEILRRLQAGRAVLLFPEGTRTDDGAMKEFKRGVAVLVKRAKCPVVPIAIEGAFDAWPRHRAFPRWLGSRLGVAFGTPIEHDALIAQGAEASLEQLAATIDRMRLDLRAEMRKSTRGRFPHPGPGDRASFASTPNEPALATAEGPAYPRLAAS